MPVNSSQPGFRVEIIHEDVQKRLEKFTSAVRLSGRGSLWRCLYCALDPSLVREPSRKDIFLLSLKTCFEQADNTRIFWLSSGHLFVFFQGSVRAVIRDFEQFLDFVGDGNQKSEYHFFPEINKFEGYFDQVLSHVLNPGFSEQNSEADFGDTDNYSTASVLQINKDILRQRRMRYKPLVLIVEDDRVTRHILQATLEKYCDISVAWNVKQARKLYESMLPNITLLDIELPDGDGQDLAELFCAFDPESFVVMVSAHSEEKSVRRCMAAGARGFIAKPATEPQLLHFINEYNKKQKRKAASR